MNLFAAVPWPGPRGKDTTNPAVTASDKEQAQMTKQTEGTEVLSEQTPVRIGLVVAFLGVFFATTLGAVIYQVSSNTKVVTMLEGIRASLGGVTDRVGMLERATAQHEQEDTRQWQAMGTRVSILEQIGSPALQGPLKVLRDDLNKLRQDFEIERANRKP